MLADKTCFCFLRCLCAFIRFISEEELRSLRLLFKVRAAYFLLAERRGPWVQGSPLYFLRCTLCRSGQTEGFLRAQGQTRWALRNLGALIWLKFYKCHAFWCMALNKSFILENLRCVFSSNAAGRERKTDAPRYALLSEGPALQKSVITKLFSLWLCHVTYAVSLSRCTDRNVTSMLP